MGYCCSCWCGSQFSASSFHSIFSLQITIIFLQNSHFGNTLSADCGGDVREAANEEWGNNLC